MGHVFSGIENAFGKGPTPRQSAQQVGGIADIQKQFANQILGGQVPSGFMPGIENQYEVARKQAMDLMPRGGELNTALGNIDTARAQQISSLPAQLLPLAMGSLGQAQGAYNMLGQQTAQKKMGTGQALGKMGAAAILA